MYDSLADLSDIASLPASLFSTPVKLSDPYLLNFFSPFRNIFVRLNAKTRAIISEFPFIVLMDKVGAIISEFPFTTCLSIYLSFRHEDGSNQFT
jgi:hypothetical protein